MIKKSILAGVAISIGCIAYLITGYAWLFPIGLFIVCTYKLNLFTGKVCYVNSDPFEIAQLIYIWLFNIISAYGMGVLMQYVRPDLIEKAHVLYEMKMSTTPGQFIVKAILCNVMIFVAVDVFKKFGGTMFGFTGLIFATTIFVACGFEHCVANSFYLGLGTVFNMQNIVVNLELLIINTVFNAIGGIFTYRLMGA